MGTHPIFESDFDCLTVEMLNSEPPVEVMHGVKPIVEDVTKKYGQVGQFLTQAGYGWLLEQDELPSSQVPLFKELDIDLNEIWYKIRCVLLPLPQWGYQKHVLRDNPDFWGPLCSVILFALISMWGQSHVAGWICSVWFGGSALVFFIARVIGGNVSYSQCLGVIGYSILPLSVGCILMNLTASIYGMDTIFWFVGIIWASYSSSSLLISEEYHEKKPLLLYPIMLLFIYFMHLHTGV